MPRARMTLARACHRTRKSIPFLPKHLIQFGILLLAMITLSHGQQYHRRPAARPSSASSVQDAYRQKWLEFLRLRTTVPPPIQRHPVRGSNSNSNGGAGGSGLVINGFQCERTYELFPNRSNARMYHLCARSRDNWYVYHYFCPHGSTFNEGQKRCMQEKDRDAGGNSNVRSTTVRNRRPYPSTTALPSTRRPSTTTTATTTVQVPEPTYTEGVSSEEFSTEEEMRIKDVVIHGVTMPASDEIEEVTKEYDESSDESNMILDSDNEPSRLSPSTTTSTTSTPPPEIRQKDSQKRKKPTPPPSKPKKHASGETEASGGRRPRILKKWRGYISKY